MRWLLSIFHLRREPPSLREIPLLLFKCVVLGILSGPFLALFFTLLTDVSQIPRLIVTPAAIGATMIAGAIFLLSFYIFCGLGNAFLRRVVTGPSGVSTRIFFVVYNSIASSFAFFAGAALLTRIPFGSIRFEIPYFRQILIFEAIAGAVLALVIGAFVRLKIEIQRTQAKLHEKELNERRLAEQTARAQALALQSQINPHFFFNTLNTISAMIEDNPRGAQRTIGQLADLFRYTLGCTHSEAVAIGQEVQFVRDYLAIEQARFSKRLRVELPEGPLPDIRVPGLVLQPLVENAVKYGIARRIEGGTVAVAIAQEGAKTRVSVRNTASDDARLDPAALFRPGHALENVRARLRLFTGEDEPLRFRSDGEWTEVTFEMTQ